MRFFLFIFNLLVSINTRSVFTHNLTFHLIIYLLPISLTAGVRRNWNHAYKMANLPSGVKEQQETAAFSGGCSPSSSVSKLLRQGNKQRREGRE